MTMQPTVRDVVTEKAIIMPWGYCDGSNCRAGAKRGRERGLRLPAAVGDAQGGCRGSNPPRTAGAR